jgi:hypothetical protein
MGAEKMIVRRRPQLLSLSFAVLITLGLGTNRPMWAGSPDLVAPLPLASEVNPLLAIEDAYASFESDALDRGAIGFYTDDKTGDFVVVVPLPAASAFSLPSAAELDTRARIGS